MNCCSSAQMMIALRIAGAILAWLLGVFIIGLVLDLYGDFLGVPRRSDAAAEAEQERLRELLKKDEASRENARRMTEAARARAARLHEQYLLK